MARHFRISESFIRRLDDLGLAREAVLARAGLPPTLFAQDKVLLTTTELFALHQSIAAVSNDPNVGLRLGHEGGLLRYDAVSIVALHAGSLADALPRLQRYKQLITPEVLSVEIVGDECRVRFDWPLAEVPEPSIVTDLCFAWLAGIARRGSDNAVRPMRVELVRARERAEVYEKHFGCKIVFGAPANTLVFAKEDTERPFVTHNAELLALVAPQLEAELREQLANTSFSEQVKATLKKTIAGHPPELRQVARALGMSTRTLQRRLSGEDVTFQQLVAEARRELARHYLRHSQLELNETAYLLGYKDANSFFRAFHQWEGTTPGEWRAQNFTPPERTVSQMVR